MSFRRILLGLLTFWIGLMGLVFGTLFAICLILYLLWHGLSISIIAFGGLCLGCIMITRVALRRATVKGRTTRVKGLDPTIMAEAQRRLYTLSADDSLDGVKRHKMS